MITTLTILLDHVKDLARSHASSFYKVPEKQIQHANKPRV